MRNSYTLRPATQDDIPFLVWLRAQTMADHFHNLGLAPTDDEHMERIHHRFECAQIVVIDGKASGLFKVARDGNEWRLIQMQLRPSLQGMGMGSKLLESLIDAAGGAGATVSLAVLKRSPALNLYSRLGFKLCGEHENSWEMKCMPTFRTSCAPMVNAS